MKFRSKSTHSLLALLVLLLGVTLGCTQRGKGRRTLPCLKAPRNVIFAIGDGMGRAQLDAGSLYAEGTRGALLGEFTHRGEILTSSADDLITDSAAAASAMATGVKVGNGVLSLRIPGDGSPLETLLEKAAAAGKATGLVTTTYITHATPAAFVVHQPNRHLYDDIAAAFLGRARPDVILGGAKHVTRRMAEGAGYQVVTTRSELEAVPIESDTPVWGLFGADHMPYEYDGTGALPHLSEMTAFALGRLSKDPDGFFLMFEGGRIDHAGHENDIERLVREVSEFSKAVRIATDWAQGRSDTLILVTADHETGGLRIQRSNGKGVAPEITWNTDEHTGDPVPIYALGMNAEHVWGTLDNTAVFTLAGGCDAGAR